MADGKPAIVRPARALPVLAACAVLGAGLAGCSSSGSSSPAVSSAASKGVSAAASAASSAASSLKGSIDATGDVTLGPVTTGSDGKATTQATITNHTSSTSDYLVTVDFTDASGNVLDATVVTVDGVPAGQTKTATVRSNRDLTGTVNVKVVAAVRH